MTPAVFKRWGVLLARIGLLAFAVGLALRLTFRDSVDGLSVIYYATPWPVLAILPLGEAFIWILRRRVLRATALLSISAACGAVWVQNSYFSNTASPDSGGVRLLLWNAEHPKRRLPQVVAHCASVNADVLLIAESESTKPADQARWRAAFPGYSVHNLAGGLLFLSRMQAKREESGSLGRGGHYHVLRLEHGGEELVIIPVDFSAAPLRSRRPAFAALASVLERYGSEKIIVLGDFNTPRESVYFERLRALSQHAFETAGSGFAETWPIPAPVLNLDHVWVSRALKVGHCRLGWWWISDHRPVVVDLVAKSGGE